jgi:hypothetical protein
MSQMRKNLSVHQGYVVKHHLKFDGLIQGDSHKIQMAIEELPGIVSVDFNEEQEIIFLEYDASQLYVDEILVVLREYGIEPKDSWWNRMKLGFGRQTDQNIRDNAGHHPACCSKPPTG